MALIITYKKKSHGITWKSGHIFSFKYTPFQNDNKPLIIVLNIIEGIHPNTGHQHRYIQGLNLHYVPRKDRKRFIKIWQREIEKGTPLKFTWKKVKTEFPYLKFSIRRYQLKPVYYISSPKEIPIKDWEKEVIGSLIKDFSSKIKRKIISVFKKRVSGKR